MKEITLFLLKNCPHCKLALRLQEELLEEHPAWRDIPLRMVDEAAEPAYAIPLTTTMSPATMWTA